MSELPRYWSPAFVEVYTKALNADLTFQKVAQKFTGAILLQCWDDPDGMDVSVLYRIDKGHVSAEPEFTKAPSPLRLAKFDKKKAVARSSAPYALWQRLDSGEINILQGLASPAYKVDGKLKIMANIKLFNSMSDVAARIEKTY